MTGRQAARTATIQGLFGGSETSPIPDPYPVYARLRRERPVLELETVFGTCFLVTRYDDVRAILRDDARFSNRSNAKEIGLVMGRTIIEMDGREHLRHRGIVTPALAPRALRGDFPKLVDGIAQQLIDGFATRGRADLVAEFTFSYPLRVLTRILGVPGEDHEAVHRWATDLTRIASDPARGLAAARTLGEYLAPIVAERETDPTADLISRLAHGEVDGKRLTREEVTSFLRLLVVAGAETTYHLIGSALFALLSEPRLLGAVQRDRDLLDAVLEETLRWESPVQLVTRESLAPARLGGVEIPAGGKILVAIGSANRDEARFERPDAFDPGRGPIEHLAFGFGKHYCAGSRLAHLEARTALEALLDRLPDLRLAPGEACGVVGLAFRGPDRLPVLFDA